MNRERSKQHPVALAAPDSKLVKFGALSLAGILGLGLCLAFTLNNRDVAAMQKIYHEMRYIQIKLGEQYHVGPRIRMSPIIHCNSDLRKLGMGLRMYSAEYCDKFPIPEQNTKMSGNTEKKVQP